MALLSGAHDGSLVSASQILGPTVAFAQEGASDGLTEFSFEVVCVDEVGIHVVDITKKNEKGDPADVPGATVIIKSPDFPDKTTSRYTCLRRRGGIWTSASTSGWERSSRGLRRRRELL